MSSKSEAVVRFNHRPPPLKAALARAPDGTTDLTLYPADSPDHELVTNWLTAAEGSYVALGDWL